LNLIRNETKIIFKKERKKRVTRDRREWEGGEGEGVVVVELKVC